MLDRKYNAPKIEQSLADGYFTIANRYIPSNMAYMAAHLPLEARPEFIAWIKEAEYSAEANNMPQEDLVIMLRVKAEIGQSIVDKRNSGSKTKKDIL